MVNTTRSMAIACVMGVFALGSSSGFAYTTSCPDVEEFPLNGCDLPGTVEGSFPYFDNVVAVSSKAKFDKEGAVTSFNISAAQYKGSIDNHLVVDDTTSYLIEKPSYKLSATFIDETTAEGSLKIGGKINGEKFSVTADLAGPVDFSDDSMLWGFDTMNIVCSDLINTLTGGCTTNEVVYLNLLEAIGPDFGAKINTAGRALTSVPVPAAAWLFGSGLLGLIAVSRRRGDSA
jgi:hypothetical protein